MTKPDDSNQLPEITLKREMAQPKAADLLSVTDYLNYYIVCPVELTNPLTGQKEIHKGAEAIALMIFIAALNGDKAAQKQLMERTEGRVGMGEREPGKKPEDDLKSSLATAERNRQDKLKAARPVLISQGSQEIM